MSAMDECIKAIDLDRGFVLRSFKEECAREDTKWPVCGEKDTFKMSMKVIRELEAQNGELAPLELAYAIDEEVSYIVNNI